MALARMNLSKRVRQRKIKRNKSTDFAQKKIAQSRASSSDASGMEEKFEF